MTAVLDQFGRALWCPSTAALAVLDARPGWNATTALDRASLALVAVLGWRFLTTGGREMLRMMSGPRVDPGGSRSYGG